jgi:outer membrane protein
MNKYKILLGSFMTAALMFSGCQDIDLLPKDNLSDVQYWKTPEDFMKEVNLMYDRAESFGTRDTDSDIGFELNENVTSNGTLIAPNKDGEWNDRYSDVRHCNIIIEKGTSYEGDKSKIERYIAEAHFFRAYTYWRLLKRFNEVSIVKEAVGVDSQELYGKRNSQAEVEDFILSELDNCWQSLPLQSELSGDELGRVTQGAALALKARVALFAGTWAKYHQHRSDYQQLLQQAIDAAEKVVESKEYSLFEGAGDDSYRKLFIDDGDDSSEGIFDSRYFTDIRQHSTAHLVYWGWRGTPTKKLADMYRCKSTGLPIYKENSGFKGFSTIASEYENRDPRMRQTFVIPGTIYWSPQIGRDSCVANFTVRPETRTGYKLYKFMAETYIGTDKDAYDYHIIRYPEVLLILAEATYEKDGAISDNILNKTINVIRSRKGVEMPPLTNNFVKVNGLDMLEEIRCERTVELAFEGFRRDDLRRWKTAETELKQPIRGIKLKNSQYEKLNVLNEGNPGLTDEEGFLIVEPSTKRFFTTPKNYYYSVPLDELYLNPNLAPNNPGW